MTNADPSSGSAKAVRANEKPAGPVDNPAPQGRNPTKPIASSHPYGDVPTSGYGGSAPKGVPFKNLKRGK